MQLFIWNYKFVSSLSGNNFAISWTETCICLEQGFSTFFTGVLLNEIYVLPIWYLNKKKRWNWKTESRDDLYNVHSNAASQQIYLASVFFFYLFVFQAFIKAMYQSTKVGIPVVVHILHFEKPWSRVLRSVSNDFSPLSVVCRLQRSELALLLESLFTA